jgi:subtilisin family serine protease
MRYVLRPTALLAAFLAAACQDTPSAPEPPASSEASARLEGDYIVVFHDGVRNPDQVTDQLLEAFGGVVRFRYRSALKGFAATLPDAALGGISRNPNVSFIEPDGVVTASVVTQTNATWGLDRIDQRMLPLSSTYQYDADGTGVRAYIIDTGIRATHLELSGRVLAGFTAISDGRGTEDCNGHGTHVAGTVGGTTYGVAKSVTFVPVRVLGCQGSGATSGVIAGVDWVTANAVKPAVANMSLGGGASSSLDNAVTNSINSGVTYAVSAGNSAVDACGQSPARAAAAITVGATTSTDSRASYSNFGTCLDIFAPGSSITSAWSTSNTAINTISGTSMASPHVAGVAALVLQGSPSASGTMVRDAIVTASTTGVVGNAGSGSPNRLLFSLGGAGGGGDPPPPSDPVTIFVQDITSSASRTGGSGRWKAQVTVLVHNDSGSPVSGVTVTGSWSNGLSGSTSCTTGSSGRCSFQSGNIAGSTASVTWTVGVLSASGATYAPSSNVESSVLVLRP